MPQAAVKLSSGRAAWFARLLTLLVVFELTAIVGERVLNPFLNGRIRTVREELSEQTDMVRQMLDTSVKQLHEVHPELGWRYAPNYRKAPDQLNASALRSAREYSATPPPNVARIAAFGDSFTYGSEVENDEAWAFQVERDAGLEVLNYGVPGYGSDQAYIRYELEGADYAPELVLLGFAPTDLSREVNVYRRFFGNTEPPLFKPRFVLDKTGQLSLVQAPVRDRQGYEALIAHPEAVIDFGANDQWFEPFIYRNPVYDYSAAVRLASRVLVRAGRRLDSDRLLTGGVFNTHATAFRIQLKLFEKFVSLAHGRQTMPLVLFLPDRPALEAIRYGKPPSYRPLLEETKSSGIEYLDAAEAFAAADLSAGTARWFARFGHYNREGSQVVATWLANAVRARLAHRVSRCRPVDASRPGEQGCDAVARRS